MNTKEGESGDVDVLASQWRFHPTDAATDVAVLEWPATATDFDMLTWPILQASATDEAMRKWGIGVGDEVFMIGLFHKHYGKTKNIPIMRIGNIAAMPEEPIAMRTGPDALMDAYLIEMRLSLIHI